MKRKILSIVAVLTIASLSACGPAPTPTLSADDIRNTGVAMFWIGMTMTQAALPTATMTPIPPSPTPAATLAPFPTLLPFVDTAVPVAQPTDACNQVPPLKPKGTLVNVKLVNKSGGNVNLSLGMSKPNDQGECVTYSYTLNTFGAPVVTVLAGCYWAYGWVSGKKPSTARTMELLCMTDPNSVPSIWIGSEVIDFHQ
jgi:hypothetical protein